MNEFERLLYLDFANFIVIIVLPVVTLVILSNIVCYLKLKKEYNLTGKIDSRLKFSFHVLAWSQLLGFSATFIYIVLTLGFGLFDIPRIIAIDVLAIPIIFIFSIYSYPYILRLALESPKTTSDSHFNERQNSLKKIFLIIGICIFLLFLLISILNSSGLLRYFLGSI